MRADRPLTQHGIPGVRDRAELVVAVDVGSALVACAVAEVGPGEPLVLSAESACSFGIRGGEIVDIKRAGEAIRIAIEAAADRAEADVKTVVVGLSGDVKLSTAKAAMELDRERRTVTPDDVARLRAHVSADAGAGRRVVHRFDGPCGVGDLQGIEYPEGLCGDRLEMQATFVSAAGDRLDNLLRAVRSAGVEIEAVALEPVSGSLGALSEDERALGAAVIDMGAGAFRGALWEGGRLRQIHAIGREGTGIPTGSGRCLPPAAVGGMEGVVLAVARRFRIAPATAERLLRSHAALGDDELLALPPAVDVAAVDGLGSVRVETRELSRTIEELMIPVARALRDGLSGFSAGHAVGMVLIGGGARIKGMPAWFSRRFGNAPVRLGVPHWKASAQAQIPADLQGCCACSLSGLIAIGAEGRARLRPRAGASLLRKFAEGVRRFAASL